ncbi:uncharacterized protein LOC106665786 [Cimex lectularius]|uniref:Uncharacterized protein n=1 Tax=Cimex lectularius TaxID=79782 RepID=A0A8I6RN32_CIMLE|nr:uncharacterized protein LOC106665786 [Cimex lectularius]
MSPYLLLFALCVLLLNGICAEDKVDDAEVDKSIIPTGPAYINNEKRTLFAMSVMGWMSYIFKNVYKPVRRVYVKFQPEIVFVKCLLNPRMRLEQFKQEIFKGNRNNLFSDAQQNYEDYYMRETPSNSYTYNTNYPMTSDYNAGMSRLITSAYNTWIEMADKLKKREGMWCIIDYCKRRFFRWLDE